MESGAQIARAAGLVSVLTLASRVLGLLRDAVLAARYPRRATDAFVVANTIPNALRRLLAEGVLTAGILPVLARVSAEHDEARYRRVLASLLGICVCVMGGIAVLGLVCAPWIVSCFAYGLADDPASFATAVLLTRVMIGFCVLASVSAISMGALNTRGHFATPALGPAVLNLGILGCIAFLGNACVALGWPPVLAAGVGVMAGGVMQVLIQVPALGRYRLLVLPHLSLADPYVRRVFQLTGPALLGLGIYELNVMLARQLASFLPHGAISSLYFAHRLVEFPMGLFAVAIATVASPSYSRLAARGDTAELRWTYGYAMRQVLFIILPATAGLIALATPVATTLFERGEFTAAMTRQTARALIGLVSGLWAAAGVKQTVPVFYALQDTKTPVKVAALSLLVYAALALCLRQSLGTLGLALAVSGSSVANFTALAWLLRRRLGRRSPKDRRRGPSTSVCAVRSVASALLAGAVAHIVSRQLDFTSTPSLTHRSLMLLGCVAAGIAAYVAASLALRSPEVGELLQALKGHPKNPR